MRPGSITTGLIGGGMLSLFLAMPALDAVFELLHARTLRAIAATRLALPPARPAPIVAPGLAMPNGSASASSSAIAERVRRLAASGGVLVEMARASDPGPGLAGLSVRLSGPEKAVIALADTIERDAVLIRFRHWRATAIADGKLRLEGELLAAWR